MTHTPPESKAWPNAGAADRPSASGEQVQRQGKQQSQGQGQRQGGQPASDLPSAAQDEPSEAQTPFPEAGRHEADTPQRDSGRGEDKDVKAPRREASDSGRSGAGSDSERT